MTFSYQPKAFHPYGPAPSAPDGPPPDRQQKLSFWTPERDEILKACVDDPRKLTSGTIAAELGCSRGSVIWRVEHIGLKLHNPSRGRRFRMPDTVCATPLPQTPEATGGVTLAELGPEQCRFPVNDAPFLFCGAADCIGPYCGEHKRICCRC